MLLFCPWGKPDTWSSVFHWKANQCMTVCYFNCSFIYFCAYVSPEAEVVTNSVRGNPSLRNQRHTSQSSNWGAHLSRNRSRHRFSLTWEPWAVKLPQLAWLTEKEHLLASVKWFGRLTAPSSNKPPKHFSVSRSFPSTYISGLGQRLFCFLFLLEIVTDKFAGASLTFPQKISLSPWEQSDDHYLCSWVKADGYSRINQGI